MVFIVIFNIILYGLLIIWTYKNMYSVENKVKFVYIFSALLFIYILTKILYNIGGNPIGSVLGEAASTFNRTMQSIFTGINGLIIMPYIGNCINKMKEQTINTNQFKRRIIIIGIIFILFMIFEFNYIKDMQVNMYEMINQK